MRALLVATVLFLAVPAAAQEVWGTLPLLGGVPAARSVLNLGGNAGTLDEFWLLDFVQRFHSSQTPGEGPDTLRRYVALLEQVRDGATQWPGGFVAPPPKAPRADRDRARRYLELFGLQFSDGGRVQADSSRDARVRQEWLAAAGIPVAKLVERLNAREPVPIELRLTSLPLPLPGYWAGIAGQRAILEAITGSRESALMYAGLMSVPPETLAFLAGQAGLLGRLSSDHAAAFAGFGRSIHVQNGRVVAPGDEPATALWEALAESRLDAPTSFVPALLSVDNGRLAYFYDTVSRLDPVRQAWVLGTHVAQEDRRQYVERVYEVFRRSGSIWNITQRPFFRPDLDPALVLHLTVRNADVIAGAPWWPSLLERITGDGEWPGRPEETLLNLRDRNLDASWLLSWVFEKEAESAGRFQMFRFAQRIAADADRAGASDLEILLRAVRDLPTVPPALERMGLRDLKVMAAVARAARVFDERAQGEALARLARWQSMLALVEQVQLRRRLPPPEVAAILTSLVAWAGQSGRDADGRAAAWLVDELLPVIAADVRRDDSDLYERDVLLAVTRRPDAARAKVFWEGLEYVLDDSFATVRDALSIRTAQSSPTLGDLVVLHSIRRRIEAGLTDRGQVAALLADLTRAQAALVKLPQVAGREIDAVVEFRRVVRAVERISNDRGARGVSSHLPEIRYALDAMVDGAVLPLVYAMAVSPAGPAPATFVDLFARHTWTTGEDATGVPAPSAWKFARSEVGPVMETIIRGSVIGLDLAFADSRLRAGSNRPPPGRPAVVSDEERAALLRSMRGHAVSAPQHDDEAARVSTAIAAGRNALAAQVSRDPDRVHGLLREAGVDALRAGVIAWQIATRVPVTRLATTRLDHYRLGTRAPLPAGWGISGLSADGGWVIDGAPVWPIEEWTGRLGAGVGAAVASDVFLALLEGVRELGVPAAVVPSLLPLAAHDLLAEVRQHSVDDARAIRDWARTVTTEQVEAYLLALVSARILSPPGREGRY